MPNEFFLKNRRMWN